MKHVGNTLADAIARAERTLADVESGRERVGAPNRAREAARVTKLAEIRAKKRKTEAEAFARQARVMGLDAETLHKVEAAAAAHATRSETWIFVMLSPQQNAAVIRWINANSKRPHKAVELWATLLEHLRMDTGEITASRQELADRVGMKPNDLSKTMSELASINAVRREKQGRAVKYYLNPGIATHVPNPAARAAARENAGPLLKLMETSEDKG